MTTLQLVFPRFVYISHRYMFFFQLPWLPEMLMMTEADVDVYKHALHSWGKLDTI